MGSTDRKVNMEVRIVHWTLNQVLRKVPGQQTKTGQFPGYSWRFIRDMCEEGVALYPELVGKRNMERHKNRKTGEEAEVLLQHGSKV